MLATLVLYYSMLAKTQARSVLMEKRLAMMEEERNRIAADMHDGLSADLAAVAWKSAHIASKNRDDTELEELSERARAAIDAAATIVWALRPEGLDVSHLSSVLRRKAVELDEERVRVEVVADDDVNERRVNGVLAADTLRVVQEAVRNALRHGQATSVEVRVNVADQLRVDVLDDGIGADLSEVENSTGGIRNLRRRAERHGGTLAFQPRSEGTGMHLVVEMPIAWHG